ncbi:MAG TPA: SDR family NAD(P)-dependent oxidoreductase [Kiritimatiellia bacterium]|jgi:NAD(P)-dependent dehydrogenase (short-subunit alcohol dehydrogenase family)|nr:SDR family NAD(P)-dependent oxidoreductase [Kiritimatiellia bacterium]HQL50863.1 SDR family NAD(P)-dependent oxidoreductase [Kiritimatiellia bacterium]
MQNFLDFKGKTALVTGAAGAIGKGVAQGLAQCGARVFVTDLKQDQVDAAVAELTAAGYDAAGLAADVTDEAQVKAVAEFAAARFDNVIDILVNVAGVAGQKPVEEITEREWDFVFAVNCKGTFFFIKHVVPLMKMHKSGKIVNFASKSGKTGSALCSHYSAAKGAIITLTQSLAFEFAKDGINVNCVCPGITDHTGVWNFMSANYIDNLKQAREQVVSQFTAKVPLGRLASIEDVVDVTVFLCSSGADYMTGQAINITGGREMH